MSDVVLEFVPDCRSLALQYIMLLNLWINLNKLSVDQGTNDTENKTTAVKNGEVKEKRKNEKKEVF